METVLLQPCLERQPPAAAPLKTARYLRSRAGAPRNGDAWYLLGLYITGITMSCCAQGGEAGRLALMAERGRYKLVTHHRDRHRCRIGGRVGGAGCWWRSLLAGQVAGPCGLEVSAAAPWMPAADAKPTHLLWVVAGELAELPHLALRLIHRMATNAWSCGFVGVWVHAACTRSAALWKSVAGLERTPEEPLPGRLAWQLGGQHRHIRPAQPAKTQRTAK